MVFWIWFKNEAQRRVFFSNFEAYLGEKSTAQLVKKSRISAEKSDPDYVLKNSTELPKELEQMC